MATTTIFGPFHLYFNGAGFGPGEIQHTWWHDFRNIDGALINRGFTVTATANPDLDLPSDNPFSESVAEQSLTVLETRVQIVPIRDLVGGFGRDLILNITVLNSGQNPIQKYDLMITFVTQ